MLKGGSVSSFKSDEIDDLSQLYKRYENHDVVDIMMNPKLSFLVLRMIMVVVMMMVVAMIRLGCVWIQQSICKGRIGSARNKGGRRPNVKTSCL